MPGGGALSRAAPMYTELSNCTMNGEMGRGSEFESWNMSFTAIFVFLLRLLLRMMIILVLLSQLIVTSSRNVFGIGAYFPPGIEQIDDAAPLVGKSRITHWHSTTIVDSTNWNTRFVFRGRNLLNCNGRSNDAASNLLNWNDVAMT